jgi:hypothetical protein
MRSNTAFHDNKSSILKPISWLIYVMYVQVEVDPFKFLLIPANEFHANEFHDFINFMIDICDVYASWSGSFKILANSC